MDNLFEYATSELSHDAFLCWLISASKAKYFNDHASEYEREVSQGFLRAFCGNYHGKIIVDDNGIVKQENNIDVLVKGKYEHGEKFVICIENKTSSKEHGEQLKKYKEYINRGYFDIKNRHFVYYKTGIQDNIAEINKYGYTVFQIYEIYELLSKNGAEKSKQQILSDYYKFIKKRYDAYQSFVDTPLKEWSNNAFIGFYQYILGRLTGKEIDQTKKGFGYSNNASGGHWTLWFGSGKIITTEKKMKIGFNLNLEMPNQNAKKEWLCRLIIRAYGYDNNSQKYKTSDIKQFFGQIGNTDIERRSSKFIILSELFKIEKGSRDSGINRKQLEEKVMNGLDEYIRWQDQQGFK